MGGVGVGVGLWEEGDGGWGELGVHGSLAVGVG